MEQKYTSANTSINKSKLPAIYNKLKFEEGMRVLDYGCGKYTDHIKDKMNDNGCEWFGYDKYNVDEAENIKTEREMKQGFDIGICSNVLNVIEEDEIIKNIIKEIKSNCENSCFYIYEGNGSGIGNVSKDDCYQRNNKVSYYAELMKDMGYEPKVKGKMITI